MKPFLIGNRRIDSASRVLVIAEIGVNHDGSVQRALELVRISRDAGADAVKLQVFCADTLMHGAGQFAAYQQQTCTDTSPAAMLRRLELSDNDNQRVVRAIQSAGMIPIATPFSLDDVKRIQQLNLPAIKIASPDLVNYPLLEAAADSGNTMLISTGAATMDEVTATANLLKSRDASFALLHCVSCYPTPADQAHLGWIDELQSIGVPVGYSDHTTETMSGALAVAAGACVIEKHLTYNRSAIGPDHSASADPKDFAEYVRLIHVAETMRGVGGKCVLPIERDVRSVSRQSLVLRRDLSAGQQLNREDLIVQRPGTGIPAADFGFAVGRRAARPIAAGTLLQWDMLTDAA